MSKPLTFNLKQHTPMLHFQASQQGATLRASDVKPRFDRWLIDQKLKWDFEKCKKYLIGYPGDPEEKGLSEKVKSERKRAISLLKKKFESGFRALNYKMRIVRVTDNKPTSTHWLNQNNNKMVSGCPSYFGEEMETVMNDCKVSFLFTESSNSLQDIVKPNFAEFINSHNFGTRSTKGYGSFTVEQSDSFPELSISFDKDYKWQDIEKKIELFYKTIRSGINFTKKVKDSKGYYKREGYYFKSMLYQYVNDKYGQHWDKKIIKNCYLGQNDVIDNKFDYRDCLGLSSHELWGDYNITIKKTVTDIDRFASPVVFKPVRSDSVWSVYIVLNQIPQNYQGDVTVSAIQVENKPPDKRLIKNFQSKTERMKLPDNFSLISYFDYLFKDRPGSLSHEDWLEANDISRRFEYENDDKLSKSQKGQINDIVDFYKKLRQKYYDMNSL